MDVVELRNVLTPEQCSALISAFADTLFHSMVGGYDGQRIVHHNRTSSSVKIESGVPETLRERVASLCGLPIENQERWEIIRYNVGEHFSPHYDFLPKPDASGQRLFSAVLFLQAPELGGATEFPHLGRSFEPEQGKLLLWRNTESGGCCAAALHASAPVLRGTKWSLVTWIRERRVQTGGGGAGGSVGTGG